MYGVAIRNSLAFRAAHDLRASGRKRVPSLLRFSAIDEQPRSTCASISVRCSLAARASNQGRAPWLPRAGRYSAASAFVAGCSSRSWNFV